jgi:hypothetical protein
MVDSGLQGVWTMTLHARVLVITTVVMSGLAFATSPVAASAVATRAANPTCGPKMVTQFTAPGVGQQAVYNVRRAGTVTLLEVSTTTLRVTDADAASDWKDTVIVRMGTRVHVGFQQIGAPEEQERFWARLNTVGTPGTIVNIIVQTCT